MNPGTASLFAAGFQVVGNLLQGEQGYAQGRNEAAIAEANAKTARENAARARRDAALAEEAQRREARKSLGRSAAAIAQSGAAGAGLGQGSAGAVLKQASTEAELDALNIRYSGEQEAQGHLTEAAQFDMERKAALQRAKGARLSGIFGAATAGLSGFANYRGAEARQKARTRTTPKAAPKASSPGGRARVRAYGSDY